MRSSTILLGDTGRALLSGFGLSKSANSAGDSDSAVSASRTSLLAGGTIAYIAPERFTAASDEPYTGNH